VKFNSPIFKTLSSSLRLFPQLPVIPSVEQIDTALSVLAQVRFVAQQAPKSFEPVPPYNQLVTQGQVPTREGHSHDFMNALVWSVFPKSKMALHQRQRRSLERRKYHGNRTPEEDALAILDEGGILHVNNTHIVFGHAIYECVALERELVPPRALTLGVVGDVDVALANLVSDETKLLTKNEMQRLGFTDIEW
jgi:hypothetical protein